MTEAEDIINSVFPISKKSFSEINELLVYKDFKSGSNLISINKTEVYEYFILEGICGSYLHNPEGDEIIISFFNEKSVISPHLTRTKNDISLFNLKSLTDSKVAVINAKDFLNLMINNLEIREFGNTVLRNELIKKVDKEIGFVSLTAKERLLKFRKEFPSFENLIPHPYIASYLGITNVSLSRLRKEISK
jgi:CRP-like cAMP-binding protein